MTPYLVSSLLVSSFLMIGMSVRQFSLARRCPSCKQTHTVERSRRPVWVKSLLFFVPTRGYHCYACNKGFVKIG